MQPELANGAAKVHPWPMLRRVWMPRTIRPTGLATSQRGVWARNPFSLLGCSLLAYGLILW